MRKTFKKQTWLLISGLFLFTTGIIAFFSLLSNPFGFIFESSFYLTLIGLIIILSVLCYSLFERPAIWQKIGAIVLSILPVALLLITIIIMIDFRIFLYQGFPPKPTKEQWREDLQFLSSEMTRLHPGLFSLVEKPEFETEVNKLDKEINNLTDNQIIAEFARIVALPNDAHSIPNIFSFNLDWHIFPLKTYSFDNALYITGAGSGNEDLIGTRIVKIGNENIENIEMQLSQYLSAENEYGRKDRSGILIAEWLKAAGIIDKMQKANFAFQDEGGNTISRSLEAVHYLQYFFWTMVNTVERETSPAISNERKNNYWFEYQEDNQLFYFQFNRTIFQEDRPIEQFIDRMGKAVDSLNFKKFVIDLRINDGGNANIIHPLANFIINNEKINKKGKLFILIGRKTFSGGVMFASVLRNNSKAIFVGEPTGQGPIFYSGPTRISLPNSKLQYNISTRLTLSTVVEDKRPWIKPDLSTTYTYADFKSKRDPAIEAVMNYNDPTEEETDLDLKIAEKYLGRYLYSSYQILTVFRQNSKLKFSISDFNAGSFTNVNSDLYAVSETEFNTDIPSVKLTFIPVKNKQYQLIVSWGENKKIINRAADNFMLPMELLSSGKTEEAIAAFRDQKDESIKNIPGLEANLNQLGYQFLGDKNYQMAITVFKLNVELFPDSWNVWDSLGEAYSENGEKELAIKNYKKSVELNPNNLNGIRVLEELQEGN